MQGSATVTLAYDAANRRTALTLPNGIVVEYGYDVDSRLTSITYAHGGTPLGELTYGYDANGQRTSVGGSYARTGLPSALASATYDDANQIATFGGVSFTYDANGNVISYGGRSYTWNARNQLASLIGPVDGSFAYDGMGRRRAKTIGGTTTEFLYDGLNPVQELSSGAPVANLLTGLGIDEYFTRTDAAGERNYLADVLGSTVALADGSGSVQTEYAYEPFGTATTSGASTTSTYGFTGREMDRTGLYYYRSRYYDPFTQRFDSWDPVGFDSGDTNLFSYVWNSPTNLTDPVGTCPFCPVLAARPPVLPRGYIPRAAQRWPKETRTIPEEVQRPGPTPGDLLKPVGRLPLWERLLRRLRDLPDVPNPFDDMGGIIPPMDGRRPPMNGRKPPPCGSAPRGYWETCLV